MAIIPSEQLKKLEQQQKFLQEKTTKEKQYENIKKIETACDTRCSFYDFS